MLSVYNVCVSLIPNISCEAWLAQLQTSIFWARFLWLYLDKLKKCATLLNSCTFRHYTWLVEHVTSSVHHTQYLRWCRLDFLKISEKNTSFRSIIISLKLHWSADKSCFKTCWICSDLVEWSRSPDFTLISHCAPIYVSLKSLAGLIWYKHAEPWRKGGTLTLLLTV